MLRAAFVRRVGERDRIYVTRSDGSEVSWVFPTYGDALPHDLVHLVVESAFGVSDGFWGRVDGGADPALVNAEANRKGGKDKYAGYGSDRRKLLLAEALANAPWSEDPERIVESIGAACRDLGVPPPAGALLERVQETKRNLADLAKRWRGLLPKGAIGLTFDCGGASGARAHPA